MQKIGLIAGNGSYPALFISEAKKNSYEVYTVGLLGEAEEKNISSSHKIKWLNIGKIGVIISFFKQKGIQEVVLCGQVRHKKLFTEVKLDLTAIKLLATARDKRAATLLSGFCDELEKNGLKVLSSVTFLENYLVPAGPATKRKPNDKEKEDIEFGKKIAGELSRLDIGQTVVIKDRAVIAVEGFEGTDECLLRAGKYAGRGTVLVKVARPNQDMRFDVPVFGSKTIETMLQSGTSVCALTSGKTLVLDKENTIKFADENKISIVGI